MAKEELELQASHGCTCPNHCTEGQRMQGSHLLSRRNVYLGCDHRSIKPVICQLLEGPGDPGQAWLCYISGPVAVQLGSASATL